MAKRRVAVLDAMARESVVWSAWARVAGGSGMAGVDGVTVESFGRTLERRLDELTALLRTRTYIPQPLRPLTLKRGGKERSLGLPTVRDRVAQRAFLEVCGKRIDAQAAEVSFAYRRGRSWLDALARAEHCRDAGLRTVLRVDILDFFASVDHDLLVTELAVVLGDTEAAELARSWMAAPALTGNGLLHHDRGLPEGAPVSPALANAYLRSFDAAVHGRHGELVRYADDIAVFCPEQDGALAAQHDVELALARLRLRPNPGKTYVSSFDGGFGFLGWVFFRSTG